MKYSRNQIDFVQELNKHVDLISRYTKAIDEGDYLFTYPLAVSLRVILHYGMGKPLLNLLGVRDLVNYYSSAPVKDSFDDISHLVTLVKPGYRKLFDKGERVGNFLLFNPILDLYFDAYEKIGFQSWYSNQKIFILDKSVEDNLTTFDFSKTERIELSREDIIKFFSNKSGAHTDPNPPYNEYQLFEHFSSFSYIDANSNGSSDVVAPFPVQMPLQSALRQIAYELLITLKDEFDFEIDYLPSYEYVSNLDFQDISKTLFKYSDH